MIRLDKKFGGYSSSPGNKGSQTFEKRRRNTSSNKPAEGLHNC